MTVFFFWFFVFLIFGDPKTKKPKNQKKNRPIGDPKVKGQETDDCVFLVFWFFGFWKPQNQKPKKINKINRPIGDPKVKGQETNECVFFLFCFFGFWRPQNQKPKKPKKQKNKKNKKKQKNKKNKKTRPNTLHLTPSPWGVQSFFIYFFFFFVSCFFFVFFRCVSELVFWSSRGFGQTAKNHGKTKKNKQFRPMSPARPLPRPWPWV